MIFKQEIPNLHDPYIYIYIYSTTTLYIDNRIMASYIICKGEMTAGGRHGSQSNQPKIIFTNLSPALNSTGQA